jgi:voltage-gated potassium channel
VLYFTMITVTTAGYGTSGAEAVDELVKHGADPETIVVIDDRMVELDATEAWARP